MCFVIGIMEHTRIFLMDCDFSILFNYDYITIYCVNDYMLTILIIPNVFIICHVYYIHILYVSNINNAVAKKRYITLRNSFVQVLSQIVSLQRCVISVRHILSSNTLMFCTITVGFHFSIYTILFYSL